MRTFSDTESLRSTEGDGLDFDVARFSTLLTAFGRRQPLRDPMGNAVSDVHALTPPQFHSLMWLGTDGPLTMGELARRVGITEKTMTGVVDRLEEAEYLQRERDAGDRRLVRVRLTDKGAESFERIRREVESRMRALLGILDPDERATLYRLLEKLANGLEGHACAATESVREEQR